MLIISNNSAINIADLVQKQEINLTLSSDDQALITIQPPNIQPSQDYMQQECRHSSNQNTKNMPQQRHKGKPRGRSSHTLHLTQGEV